MGSELLIPDNILVASANQTLRDYPGKCCDRWGEQEAAHCRSLCGPDFEWIETDWIRARVINLRKRGELESLNGGTKRKKFQEPSGEYAVYLSSEHWKQFRQTVLEFWEYKCCLCKAGAVDVHHNTYLRIWNEKISDCVALCRKCHKRVHGVMSDGNESFETDVENGLF